MTALTRRAELELAACSAASLALRVGTLKRRLAGASGWEQPGLALAATSEYHPRRFLNEGLGRFALAVDDGKGIPCDIVVGESPV